MDPSQDPTSRKVYTIALRSYRASESVLPPYPLAKLLIVEIRTQEQGLTDRPAMTREFAISGLLKPEFIDLPTDRIRAPHISFDSFCRKVEKASKIKFDAARDELGWVQEPLSPGEKQEYWAISCELLFQNALGMMRLSTTQSEPAKALVLYLWSPAPKESIFRRSRRALSPPSASRLPPVIEPALDKHVAETLSQTPSSSATSRILDPTLNRSRGVEANVEQLWRSNSAPNEPEQKDFKAKDQKLEDLNSALAAPATSTEYPRIDGQIQLNMGKLPDTVNPANIKGKEKQLDKIKDEY